MNSLYIISFLLLINLFQSYSYVNTITNTRINRNIKLYNENNEITNDNTKSKAGGSIPKEYLQQFNEWEKEELYNQQLELQNQIKSEVINEGIIPDYMLKLLELYDKHDMHGLNESIEASKLPTVAIIGRPNTGKSTLVNKLSNSYKDGSIVHDDPGITRDRTYKQATWNDYNFQVVDTGGIVFDDTTDIFADRITEQALLALSEANAAILVCDGQEGVTQLDTLLAEWLRRNNKVPLYLAINKCESETLGISQAQEFWELGIGEPYPISGIHGTGIAEILDQITTKHLPKVLNVKKEDVINVAIIGRPNVGKSSLFNRLYGASRSIVSDVAGTTRDAIDAVIERNNKKYRIIDTAGIRRRGKVQYGPEFFMVNRAFKAIRRSEVVIFMLDAIDGIVDQDRILAERIAEEGRGCIIVLNKWDAIAEKDDKTYLKAIDNIRSQLPVLRWSEVLLTSAKTGQRTEKLFDFIDKSSEQFSRRVSTSIINEVVQEATLWMAPPTIGTRSGRIYYSIQVTTSPPTIIHFVNDPALFTDNYERFLERKIRESLSFEGTPIKMIFRGKALRDISRAAKKGVIANVKFSS